MIQYYGGLILAALVCGFTYWKGGVPEKWGAAILASGWFLTPFINTHHGVQYGIMLLDGLCLVGFVTLSLVTRKFWALMAAALQLDDVAVHMTTVFIPKLNSYGYVTAVYIFGGYGLLVMLLLSLWEKRQDELYLPRRT